MECDRLQAAEQFRRALQMFAASLPEEKAMEVATVYPAYEVGKAYAVGEYITLVSSLPMARTV